MQDHYFGALHIRHTCVLLMRTVQYVLMDGEFEKIKNELTSIVCDTTAAKEHVAEAECQIRVVKERHKGIIGTLPYAHVPRRPKIEILYFVAF